MVPTFTCQMYSHPQKSFVYINLACFYLKQIYYININYILKAFLEVVHLSKQDYERTAQWLTYRPRLTNCSVTYLWTPYYYEKEVKCAVSQIRDGSWVKNPTKLATWPDKINGQLEKISRDPHLLTPRNSLLTLCLTLNTVKCGELLEGSIVVESLLLTDAFHRGTPALTRLETHTVSKPGYLESLLSQLKHVP